jgi:hypothetical protein
MNVARRATRRHLLGIRTFRVLDLSWHCATAATGTFTNPLPLSGVYSPSRYNSKRAATVNFKLPWNLFSDCKESVEFIDQLVSRLFVIHFIAFPIRRNSRTV